MLCPVCNCPHRIGVQHTCPGPPDTRFAVGDRVEPWNTKGDHGYVPGAIPRRRFYLNRPGEISVGGKKRDGHGLCYEVRFPDGGKVFYDESELRLAKPEPKPAKRFSVIVSKDSERRTEQIVRCSAQTGNVILCASLSTSRALALAAAELDMPIPSPRLYAALSEELDAALSEELEGFIIHDMEAFLKSIDPRINGFSVAP